MSRAPILKPVKNTGPEAAQWRVNVPAELSQTGKRQRLFFSTRKHAQAECERLKARKHNFGASLEKLSASQVVEAAQSFESLEEYPQVSLKDAARAYLETLNARAKSISLAKLFEMYLAAKGGRTPKYLRALRNTRDQFKNLHALPVSDITPGDLETQLAQMPGGSRNAVMRYLRAVFRFGVKRGVLASDPIARLDFAERPRSEVEVLSVEHVSKMLTNALENDLALLPFLVLGFFCGIRPDGELQKLLWTDVDLIDTVVTIRPAASKTRRRRFIELSENAKAWLEQYQLRGGSREGLVVRYSPQQLRTRRRANRETAGIASWPQQGMRHSFCSYWLAKHEDINRLVLLTGHDDPDTMWRHYHRGTRKADAEKFWAIRPPVAQPNIVAFRNVQTGAS
jgi:integrase